MIRGLSEKRRLPRLGKVKLGVMVHPQGGKPYPRSTDYLVCPSVVEEIHGEQPKELPIMFPVDDPEKLFPQSLKMYRTAGLFCAGDGQVARRWTDKGELKEISCPCPFLESGECGPTATLNFLLPDVPGIGVWQLVTSNQRSIVSINTALEQFSKLFGGLSGIPFTLKLEPEPIQRFDEKAGRMVKQTLHVLRLDSPLTIREIVDWRQKAGKPVEALMPAPSLDEEEPTTEAVQPGEAREAEWDISMCFAAANTLGADATEYTNYLLGVYAKDVDNLPPAAIAEQRSLLEKAQADAKAGEVLAQAIKAVARKIQKRNGRQQPELLWEASDDRGQNPLAV